MYLSQTNTCSSDYTPFMEKLLPSVVLHYLRGVRQTKEYNPGGGGSDQNRETYPEGGDWESIMHICFVCLHAYTHTSINGNVQHAYFYQFSLRRNSTMLHTFNTLLPECMLPCSHARLPGAGHTGGEKTEVATP
jgi:hypothetical protein